jgi:hypothetical protein
VIVGFRESRRLAARDRRVRAFIEAAQDGDVSRAADIGWALARELRSRRELMDFAARIASVGVAAHRIAHGGHGFTVVADANPHVTFARQFLGAVERADSPMIAALFVAQAEAGPEVLATSVDVLMGVVINLVAKGGGAL